MHVGPLRRGSLSRTSGGRAWSREDRLVRGVAGTPLDRRGCGAVPEAHDGPPGAHRDAAADRSQAQATGRIIQDKIERSSGGSEGWPGPLRFPWLLRGHGNATGIQCVLGEAVRGRGHRIHLSSRKSRFKGGSHATSAHLGRHHRVNAGWGGSHPRELLSQRPGDTGRGVGQTAQPGDVVELRPGTYNLAVDRIPVMCSGTSEQPIVIRGVVRTACDR